MRFLAGFSIALLFSTGLVAQNRSGFVTPIPRSTPSFGSVVFPGGIGLPGVQRTTGSVVHPGGSFPQIGVPGIPFQTINGQNGVRGFRRNFNNGFNNGSVVAYPVPVYVGGYGGYDPSMYYGAPAQQQQQAPPNVIVVYPPAPAAPPYAYMQPPVQSNISDVPPQQMQAQQDQQPEASHILLAFKDHSIYSAVAYWVDGDTLHYFTSANAHNQVSLSLVDRDLTKRLNEGSGLEVQLPAPK